MIKYIVYWAIWISTNSINDKPNDIWGNRNGYYNNEDTKEYHLMEFDSKSEADSFYKIAIKRNDIHEVRLDSAIYPKEIKMN